MYLHIVTNNETNSMTALQLVIQNADSKYGYYQRVVKETLSVLKQQMNQQL